jgi:hypothetical protein
MADQTTLQQGRKVRTVHRHLIILSSLLLALVFFRASQAPIASLDTWGHWKYGEWIWQHGRLPEREPFSAYSDAGRPLLDSWWLSQVAGYLIYARWGMEGIALFYALVETAKAALYLAAFRRVTGSLSWALGGLVLLLAARWTLFGVFRPQTIAEVCWTGLLVVYAGFLRRESLPESPAPANSLSARTLIAVPLLVALWTNLHGSFVLALVLGAVMLLGRAIEVAYARRNIAAVLADGEVRRLALLLVLAAAATCVNPYGPGYLMQIVRFGQTASLRLVKEWQPMVPLATYGGKAFVTSVVLVLVTLRWSPQPFRPAEVGLLVLFALAAWFAVRMLPFWTTVWPLVLLPHWQAIAAWSVERGPWSVEKAVVFRRTLGTRTLVWAGGLAVLVLLVGSPSGRWLLGQGPRPLSERFQSETPVAPADDIRQPGPVPRRVFCSPAWSDYLLWSLPPGDTLYWYSHWHCYSPERMVDGFRLLGRRDPPNGWRSLLDRYRFNCLALLPDEDAKPLCAFLQAQRGQPAAEWDVIEYAVGLVATRRTDPFVAGLLGAEAAQACVAGQGLMPRASGWAFLTHLPWHWRDERQGGAP